MIFEMFRTFWNSHAERNGKIKFRNRREAEDFVRSVANHSGGPNRAMVAMRREYLAVQKERTSSNHASEPQQRRISAVH